MNLTKKQIDDLPISFLMMFAGIACLVISVTSFIHRDMMGGIWMGILGIANLSYLARIWRNIL